MRVGRNSSRGQSVPREDFKRADRHIPRSTRPTRGQPLVNVVNCCAKTVIGDPLAVLAGHRLIDVAHQGVIAARNSR
jgi:hypothetical protein